MQGEPSSGGQTAPAPSGKAGLGTTLGAAALAVAIVAVALNFVIPGPAGSKGSTGPLGPTGEPLWADVNGTGSIIQASQATGAYEISTGQYQVNFTQDVSQCGYVANPVVQNSTGTQPAGWITVAGRAGDADAVWVGTTNPAGAYTSAPFDLVVTCTGDLWAVVSSTGSFVRGADVASTHQNSTGQYTVVFDQDVEYCGFIATLGATGSSTSVSPGSITVQGENRAKDGVYIATYNATGVAVDSSFHLLVVCTGASWAVVSSSGVFVRGSASATSTISTGSYQVTFGQDVLECAYVASPGGTGSLGVYGAASVTLAPRNGVPDAVYVSTYDPAGAFTDESFHIAVFC